MDEIEKRNLLHADWPLYIHLALSIQTNSSKYILIHDIIH